MKRFIPLIAVLVLLAGLTVCYGPGMYRAMLFRRDCRDLIDDIRAGRLQLVIARIEPSQQQQIGALLHSHVPTDYNESIVSLKMTRWERSDPATIWATVICRIEHDGFTGLYEGSLCWRYEPGRWWWDFEESYGGKAILTGETNNWHNRLIKLDEIVKQAESL